MKQFYSEELRKKRGSFFIYKKFVILCMLNWRKWGFCTQILRMLYSFIISVIIEEINGKIDWDANPMPEYLYDVKEVSLSQNSVNDGCRDDCRAFL